MINNMTNQDSMTMESVMRVLNFTAFLYDETSASKWVLPLTKNIIETHDSLYI